MGCQPQFHLIESLFNTVNIINWIEVSGTQGVPPFNNKKVTTLALTGYFVYFLIYMQCMHEFDPVVLSRLLWRYSC